ncbi:hypothetical protein ACFL5V_08435 [Fibrobacterota bacterium]
MKKVIFLSYPSDSASDPNPAFSYELTFNEEIVSIKKAIEYMEKNFFGKKTKIINELLSQVSLSSIIPLENVLGNEDASFIKQAASRIYSGHHMLSKQKWPHIKLIKTAKNEWVLFEGHRTMLAYMAAGKRILGEVPYLYVFHDDRDYMRDSEIMEFFSKLARQIRNEDWRHYSLVWKARDYRQLCTRKYWSMEELFESLRNFIY